MALVEQRDQLSLGLSRLLEQFKGKPNIEAVLSAYLKQVDKLEVCSFSLLNDRSISTAVGNQLDVLGALVNELRLGRDDEVYRVAILTRIGFNNSEGTPNQIMSLLKSLEGATKVKMWEHYPVGAVYYTNTEYKKDSCTSDTLQKISPATSGNVTVIYDPDETGLTPPDLILEEFILVDENGNFLITGVGGVLLTDTGDALVFNTLEQIRITGGEEILGEFVTGSFWEVIGDGSAELGVLSEMMPDTLSVTPLSLPEQGLLLSLDGVTEEVMEVWSASSLDTLEAPYGVAPEACVATL